MRAIAALPQLKPADRVAPTPEMLDHALLDTMEIPFHITFWRSSWDRTGSCKDPVIHRNPLFSVALGTSPNRTLAVDALHTVYYGPVMRWTSAVLWRVLWANPWGCVGAKPLKLEFGVRRLRSDMFAWFKEHGTPADRRLGDLTLTMLGSEDCDNGIHPGCMMKTKAGETGVLMGWALDLLREHLDVVPLGKDLLSAGEALWKWLDIARTSPILLPLDSQQTLMDCAQRHLIDAQRGSVGFVPKHHMFLHLTARAHTCGNPALTATWLDETLNMTLRNCASFAHRARMEERIFTLFNLQGRLGVSQYLFGS